MYPFENNLRFTNLDLMEKQIIRARSNRYAIIIIDLFMERRQSYCIYNFVLIVNFTLID